MLEALYYVSAGICIFAASFSGFVALLKQKEKLFLHFAWVCLCIASYQVFSVQYLIAADTYAAIELLRWQVFSVLALTPSFFIFIAIYTQQKNYKIFFNIITLVCLFMMFINYEQPLTIRFEQVVERVNIVLPWQQSINLIRGEISPWGKLMHGLYQALLLWVAYRSWRLFKKNEPRIAIFFSLYILAQLSSAIIGIMIDAGLIKIFYTVGFAFVILVMLMSFSLALDFRRTNQRIVAQTVKLTAERRQRLIAQKSLNMMAQVVDQSPSALLILDLNGFVVECNQACDNFWHRQLAVERVNFLDFLCLLYPKKRGEITDISHKENIHLPPVSLNEYSTPYFAEHRKQSILTFKIFITREYNQAKKIIVSCSDVTAQEQQQQAIRHIARGVASAQGDDFYHDLIANLAKLFNAKYGFIGFLSEQNKNIIRTCSVVENDKVVSNFNYELTHSPCTHLSQCDVCSFPDQVQTLFPNDALIKERAIESYICTKIKDEHGIAKGLIVLMHDEKMPDDMQLRDILDIFSSRAGAEMQRSQAQADIRKMAFEDYLTHLPNRALLLEHLNGQIAKLQSSQEQAMLIVMDLDHFKTINDVLGHDIGDDILRHIGKRLAEHCSDEFFIARQGGDEFALISRHLCLYGSQIKVSLDKLQKIINQPLQIGEHKIDIGASFGICLFPKTDETALDVIRHAELALYKAKSNGRGRYQVYEHNLEKVAQERMKMQQALKNAIANEELSLFFQPQVRQDGSQFGAEVLLRWFSPTFGFVSPAKFIPLAEETGLIHSIGEWVFNQSLHRIEQWQENSIPFKGHLSVNVSAWQFALPAFADDIIHAVKNKGIKPSSIMLEVTETGLLIDIPDTIQKLSQMRKFGIEIALDDFGTGYSSMAYLRDLPLDLLKIDKTFIDELATSDYSPITESIISIGRSMHLSVIAEGVETLAQSNRLAALGCHIYQGYYYAKPMSEDDFVAWLFTQNLAQQPSSVKLK
ncbi:EAL domain-containing protein [Motilimonas sp. 1_MG-2023]|uniref:EAL domain-containing protein n=1 Tax=Motilimonas TaxID=1914248 RepID=UPI0026E20BDE|nr:EAL domain-containing protein [Motilimonas sp. 1_MG-2023]MDO6526422.1 EAL domain-containing protein [Motilimonas sp. 1_MG-2023]